MVSTGSGGSYDTYWNMHAAMQDRTAASRHLLMDQCNLREMGSHLSVLGSEPAKAEEEEHNEGAHSKRHEEPGFICMRASRSLLPQANPSWGLAGRSPTPNPA